MAFSFQGRTIETVGVVGSGQIGPDIALYFSKVLSPFGVRVVVVDISEDALAKGQARLTKKVDRGIQSGAFSPEQGETMKQAVSFVTDYEALAGAGFVVEAATEDENIKRKIFETAREDLLGRRDPRLELLAHGARGHRGKPGRQEPLDGHPLLLPRRAQPDRRGRAGRRHRTRTRELAARVLRAHRQGAHSGQEPLRLRARPDLRGPVPCRRPGGRGGPRNDQGGRCGRHQGARSDGRSVHRDEPHRWQPDHREGPRHLHPQDHALVLHQRILEGEGGSGRGVGCAGARREGRGRTGQGATYHRVAAGRLPRHRRRDPERRAGRSLRPGDVGRDSRWT